MITYVATLRRKPGTTREDFLNSWLGRHQQLALALPYVQQVKFMPAVEVSNVSSEYDGVGLLEFRSVAELEESLASEQALILRADTATFADTSGAARVVVSDSPQDY
ncbi:MAG: EthD domain-containing protein [Actinomycetes bacterium]